MVKIIYKVFLESQTDILHTKEYSPDMLLLTDVLQHTIVDISIMFGYCDYMHKIGFKRASNNGFMRKKISIILPEVEIYSQMIYSDVF